MIAVARALLLLLATVPTLAPAQVADAQAPDEAAVEVATQASTPTLDELDESVHELGERVLISKATLKLLSELIFGSQNRGRLELWQVDRLKGPWELVTVDYYVDGVWFYTFDGPFPSKKHGRSLSVLSRPVTTGSHVLEVVVKVRARPRLFTYLEGYETEVRASYRVDVIAGELASIRVIAGTRGLAKTFGQRINVKFLERRGPATER